MKDLENSLWRASRLACAEKIIDKLHNGELLEDFESLMIRDWFAGFNHKYHFDKDGGKIVTMLLNQWDNKDPDLATKIIYVRDLSEKLQYDIDPSVEEQQYILSCIIEFRKQLLYSDY